MLKKTMLLSVLGFVFFGLMASIANAQPKGSVSGKWRITAVVPEGQPEAGTYTGELELVELNGNVTGKGFNSSGSTVSLTGTIRNGEVVFYAVAEGRWGTNYRGKVTADGRMTGTGENDPTGGGNDATYTWTATRLPAPAKGKVVKLLFVRPNRTSFEPINELTYGEPFYVEAHFDVPPTEKQKEVKLEWAAGQTRAVVVTKTADPKVFRSEGITPKRPAPSASETTPANKPAPSNNPNRTTPNLPNNSRTNPSRSENPTPLYRVVGLKANDQLTMRSGPGATNAEVGKIPPSASGVRSLGQETQVGTNTWIKVNYRGVVGWVNKRYLVSYLP